MEMFHECFTMVYLGMVVGKACHDILTMVYELEDIAILNIKGTDSRCVI